MDMDTNIDPDLEQAYALFLADLDATESALPLPAAMAEYVALAREGAFQAGWRAHREAVQPGAEPSARAARQGVPRSHLLHDLVENVAIFHEVAHGSPS